ncbi:MAG: hypothetical protein ACK42D_02200 [Candidatus Paceibacteria bacterium]
MSNTFFQKSVLTAILVAIVAFFSITVIYAQNSGDLEVLDSDVETTTENVSTSTTPILVTSPIKIEKIADTPTPVGDYVVGPGRTEVIVNPGETVTRYITVANRIASGRSFSFSVEDMSGTADGSENIVLLGDLSGPYSLRDYISFSTEAITLDLNTRATVPVTISMPPDAEPGGYYGAVLVSTYEAQPEGAGSGARSPMIARVGTLFFITVPGASDIVGELLDVSTTNRQVWYQSGPVDFNILFENQGSVHLNPYGEVRVTNLLGDEVGFVRLDPWFVLPKSLRVREVTWDREFLLGRYNFTVQINRGYDDIIDVKSFVIWVLPWKIVLGVFVSIFLILFVIRFFFRTFEFKRR